MNLEVDFAKACNEEKGFLLFTRGELAGVPEDVVAGFPEQEDGKLKVTHKTPDYVPIITYASNPKTRERVVLSYENKTIQNAPLLQQIVQLRHEAAQMLGYANHAEWTLGVSLFHFSLPALRTHLVLPVVQSQKWPKPPPKSTPSFPTSRRSFAPSD